MNSLFTRSLAMARALRDDRRGASFVEYVIVVGLVAIISIVAFQTFGQAIVKKLKEEETAVTGLQVTGAGP